MIKPHGADTLNPRIVLGVVRDDLEHEAAELPSIVVSSGAAASAVMLASGYFTPCNGFMSLETALSVAVDMRFPETGLLWPTPILNIVSKKDLPKEAQPGTKLALRDPNIEGNPVLAVQTISKIQTISDEHRATIIENVFRTNDPNHPGVAALTAMGDTLLAGPIQVLNFSYFAVDFPDTFHTAGQIRDEFAERGWETVVAFQTRNPMHRAHEELCRMAQEAVNADGILIHMLLGKLKAADIPANVRDASIRKMVELYFPENSVMVTGYGFDMMYAGPREAVLHAIFRQNAGCTHLIVGRDHAGVGDYYGAFDAQTIFDEIPDNALEIEIYRGDHTAWSKRLNKVVMFRDVPDHKPEDFLNLSGTKVREMLAAGEPLPPEFARPEVAKILSAYYQHEKS